MKTIAIEVQHFEGCPNSVEIISKVKSAMENLGDQIKYKEVLVETQEKAALMKFRGSPTVLINGIDLENMPEPAEANLACRYYKNGLPLVEQIKESIVEQLKREE